MLKHHPGQSLGPMSFPPPNLAPNSEAQFNMTGINYASGGLGILDETGSVFVRRRIVHDFFFPYEIARTLGK